MSDVIVFIRQQHISNK